MVPLFDGGEPEVGGLRAFKNLVNEERGTPVMLGHAGILSEVFVPDITTTRAMCANCGTIRPLGALPVYGQNMGVVMRCPTCDTVVLRVARTPRQLWVDPTGARLLLMADATSPSVDKLSREKTR